MDLCTDIYDNDQAVTLKSLEASVVIGLAVFHLAERSLKDGRPMSTLSTSTNDIRLHFRRLPSLHMEVTTRELEGSNTVHNKHDNNSSNTTIITKRGRNIRRKRRGETRGKAGRLNSNSNKKKKIKKKKEYRRIRATA